MNRFKGYHWADGGSQRLGLDKVASVYTNGKPWSERYRHAGGGKFVKVNNMAYIVERTNDGSFYAVYRKPDLGWENVEFTDVLLEQVQATIETILKLQEEDKE